MQIQEVSAARPGGTGFSAAVPVGRVLARHRGRLVVRTGDAEVDAEVARRSAASPGPHVVLSVVDDGIGMSPDVLERAFEPFFTTKQGRGTGLGLATVYGVVRQSGGFVRIASEPACGTTVTVYLPRARMPIADAIAEAPAPAVAGGRETVLLVEDEDDVRRVAQRVLKSRGYTVVCARNGRDALDLAARMPAIDLLLTDVVMPEMGGLELARRIRDGRSALPILFTSGYATEAIGDGGVLPADVTFLSKPFTPDALAQAVRDALDAPAAVPGPTRVTS